MATQTESYRLDVVKNDELMAPRQRVGLTPVGEPLTLPTPPFPTVPEDRNLTDREYSAVQRNACLRSWAAPFLKSRLVYQKSLRPIIAYLFTDYKCNLDCHYCWAYDNRVSGMTEDSARRSIDWLHSIGCRVLALMGGEVMVRPDFVHKITHYAKQKGFFIYLPTNGRLMKPKWIDRIGDAGVSNWNLAIDSVEDRPELPKALNPIRPYFEHLVAQQRKYGYTVMLNINITRINMDDVKELTEIARANNLATDYHLNEAPMLAQKDFKFKEGNDTFIRPENYDDVEKLLNWLEDKHKQGYKMPNPSAHFGRMKRLMRGTIEPWPCRAGQNTLIIRTDGTLAPCFPMYNATEDWGRVEEPKFVNEKLDEMKKECSTHCLSTCNYILAYCYSLRRVMRWGMKQALNGFQGASGSFD